MKKNNYFAVHKNKKPKKLPQRKSNYKKSHTALIMAMNALKIASIQSQIFKDKALKIIEASQVIVSTAQQIRNIWSSKQKYLDRINKKI